jgi:peptidoglycan/xylan/chitin deacetylase (PgdA/CDA1 family)
MTTLTAHFSQRNLQRIRGRLKIRLLVGLLAGLGLASIRFAPVSPGPGLTGRGCLVLVYHRVVARPWVPVDYVTFGGDEFTVYESSFREQLRSVKAAGGTFITPEKLDDIVRGKSVPPSKCVLVTLDDADLSSYRNAFPILKTEGVPFLIFVISGQVGSREFKGLEMATWAQLQEMTASGLATIGSHTHDMHDAPDGRNPVFTAPEKLEAFSRDLELSISTIQRNAGGRPYYFAYPYGFGTPKTDAFAVSAGMRLIFTLRPGLVKEGDPAFFVKRLMITPRNGHILKDWLVSKGTASTD